MADAEYSWDGAKPLPWILMESRVVVQPFKLAAERRTSPERCRRGKLLCPEFGEVWRKGGCGGWRKADFKLNA